MEYIDNDQYTEITKRIINAFNKVHSIYGYGFPKIIYADALHAQFLKMNLYVKRHIKVLSQNELTETFLADFIVEKKILIELKTAKKIPNENEFEFTKYLNGSEIEIARLLNFGKKPEFTRNIFANENVLELS